MHIHCITCKLCKLVKCNYKQHFLILFCLFHFTVTVQSKDEKSGCKSRACQTHAAVFLWSNIRAAKSVCVYVCALLLCLQMLIPVVWTDCECFKKITDYRLERQISWQLDLHLWMDCPALSQPLLWVCVCACNVPVCIQEVIVIGGNDSSVHIRCLMVCVCICVMNTDLPGITNTHHNSLTVNKGQEIQTHILPVGWKHILDANYIWENVSHTHARTQDVDQWEGQPAKSQSILSLSFFCNSGTPTEKIPVFNMLEPV